MALRLNETVLCLTLFCVPFGVKLAFVNLATSQLGNFKAGKRTFGDYHLPFRIFIAPNTCRLVRTLLLERLLYPKSLPGYLVWHESYS